MKAAAQVGLFVVAAVALFLGGVAFVGRRLFEVKNDVYYVIMPDAGGLAKGARVLMAGVQVGDVGEVAVDTPTQAKLRIEVKAGTKLPLSTRALISGSLVGLGDSPLSLVQNERYRGPKGYFEPGMTIEGGKAGPLDAILPGGGKDLYAGLTETLHSVRQLIREGKFQAQVQHLLTTSDQTLRSTQGALQAFTKLANRSESLLNENQPEIARILRSTEATLVSVHETATTIERYAKSDRLQNGANGLLADAHRIAQQSQSLLADLHKTLNDPKLNADLRATADNLNQTSAKLPALVDKANGIATNVERITANSQDLPAKLGTTLDNAADLEKRLGGLSDRVGGFLDRKPKGIPPISVEADLLHTSDPGYWRSDLNLSVPLNDGFVTAGLWDAFGSTRVNLQLGRTVSPRLDYRYGIYASQPSLGVDYALTPKLGFRGDLWDVNNPRFDAKLRYELGGNLIAWLGLERIFQGSSLTVGVGIRR